MLICRKSCVQGPGCCVLVNKPIASPKTATNFDNNGHLEVQMDDPRIAVCYTAVGQLRCPPAESGDISCGSLGFARTELSTLLA